MNDLNGLDAQLMAQLREDFLAESEEILDQVGPLLVQLEQGEDPEIINTIFRHVHTLKGTAGFAGFNSIRVLSHKMEDVFGAIRAGELSASPEVVDQAFAGLQLLSAMRENIVRGGDGEMDVSMVIAQLDAALRGETTSPLPAPPADAPDLPVPPVEASKAPAAPAAHQVESTVRVGLETLDTMLELVGELITARNALLTIAERMRDEELLANASVLSRLTKDLQTTVTAVRLVPVERLFNRFSGVVRNLARERGKQVRLVIEGGDTPLDRTISEEMYDPLVHLLRNAVDHGLEPTVDRRRAGKPEESLIRLSAERRGEDVILRVSDDGGGIDVERVRRVAVQRGLYSPEEAATLPDDQVIQAIFMSGFSTASQISDVSGRGVGLDVVAQHVRRLRGSVNTETIAGQGTTFEIQLPLTLAILQVQLVRVGGYAYAIPLHMVRETLQIKPGQVQRMQQGEVIFIRQVALPLRRLEYWLGRDDGQNPSQSDLKPAIVIHRAGRDEVFVVDELVGKQQVVIKPLNAYLGAVPGVEGAAILPDGAVTLVLDMDELAR